MDSDASTVGCEPPQPTNAGRFSGEQATRWRRPTTTAKWLSPLSVEHDTGPVGTSGTFTPVPTNGGPSPGSDLKLREIDVESFSLVPVMTTVRNEPVVAPAAPEPAAVEPLPQAPQPPGEPAPPAAAPSLPKTASPLPAIGLLGLLSLAAAMGLRMFDRRPSGLS
jgi:hypothetical protein